MSRDRILIAIAAGMGAITWWGTAALQGRREAWDGELYWVAGMPLLIAAAAALAWVEPKKPWRWALIPYVAQFVAMVLSSGGGLGLWPIGLVFTLLLSIPALVAAVIVAKLRAARAA